jgi:DNA polymerase III subunit gamma/tau
VGYQALYRKWRPRRFSDVLGQEHIITILQNQVRSGRISHAYLFCGARGTGKTSVAKILSRAVNCEALQDGEPCDQCRNCEQIEAVDIVEIDAASNNGVDEIRDLREKVRLSPVIGKYKVYIIDEVHMLSTGAFNALLKTLEEPPAHIIFILATTEPHKLPATVLSRCQRFDFWRLSVAEIEKRLRQVVKETGAKADEEAIREIARAADGGMRDALSILEQCLSISEREVSAQDVTTLLGNVDRQTLYTLAGSLIGGDAAGALLCLNDIINKGKDPSTITKDMILHFRNLLLTASCTDSRGLLALSAEEYESMKAQAAPAPPEMLGRAIETLSAAEAGMRASTQPRIVLESALVRLCLAPKGNGYEQLSERLAQLEASGTSTKNVKPAKADAAPKEAKLPEYEKPAPRETLPESPAVSPAPEHVPEMDAQGCFDALMQELSKKDKTLYFLLKDGEPVKMENTVLRVACDESNDIVTQLLRLPEKRQTLSKALHAATGRDMTVEIFIKKTEEAEIADDSSLIQQAIDFFGEDSVEIK